MSPDVVFALFYVLLSFCIVYPPTEFISAGFHIQNLFANFLGSEKTQFITYHIRRTCLNAIIYSLLPLGYIVLLYILGFEEEFNVLFSGYSLMWKLFTSLSLVIPIGILCKVYTWMENNYSCHPIAIALSKFGNSNTDWRTVAKDIETEFRRLETLSIQTNSITKIVCTENWIIKVTALKIDLGYQSDTTLLVKEANTYNLSHITNNSETQFLNIEVKSGRRSVEPFVIRINASQFKDLQDRVTRSITVMPTVKFYKTIVEQFVDVFKEAVKFNPLYETEQELDQCIGCMQAVPNIKIQKLCPDNLPPTANCNSCYCRPMWCLDCIATWFASRQDPGQKSQWLSSKCTCPMCRATFCVLDVCLLKDTNANGSEDIRH